MTSFHDSMEDFRKQLGKGSIQIAYKGLMDYFRELRSSLMKRHPEYSLSGIYYGYMDMTYFAFTPKALSARKLKIAIVFVYGSFRFEVWLSGANRDIQAKYWKLIKESEWKKFPLSLDPRADDYIIAATLINDPHFHGLDTLTKQIEDGVFEFTRDVESFLLNHSD